MIKTTFQAVIEDLKHKRPEHAGSPPGTSVKLDTTALEVEVAAKLFELANGHIVNVTIEQVQERMPLDPDGPGGKPPIEETPDTPEDAAYRLGRQAEEGRTPVPEAFRD